MVQMPKGPGEPVQWEAGELAALEAAEMRDDKRTRLFKLGLWGSMGLVMWGVVDIGLSTVPVLSPFFTFGGGVMKILVGLTGFFASVGMLMPRGSQPMLDDLGLDSLDPML